jgi:hypothetical protein
MKVLKKLKPDFVLEHRAKETPRYRFKMQVGDYVAIGWGNTPQKAIKDALTISQFSDIVSKEKEKVFN